MRSYIYLHRYTLTHSIRVSIVRIIYCVYVAIASVLIFIERLRRRIPENNSLLPLETPSLIPLHLHIPYIYRHATNRAHTHYMTHTHVFSTRRDAAKMGRVAAVVFVCSCVRRARRPFRYNLIIFGTY